mgnify:CR=1 FL=1
MSKFKLLAASALAAAAPFPMLVRVWNNTWREAVEPETLTVVPPYKYVDVEFKNGDQLVRAQSNCEVNNLVNKWEPPAGLFLCEARDPVIEPPEVTSSVATAAPAFGLGLMSAPVVQTVGPVSLVEPAPLAPAAEPAPEVAPEIATNTAPAAEAATTEAKPVAETDAAPAAAPEVVAPKAADTKPAGRTGKK